MMILIVECHQQILYDHYVPIVLHDLLLLLLFIRTLACIQCIKVHFKEFILAGRPL